MHITGNSRNTIFIKYVQTIKLGRFFYYFFFLIPVILYWTNFNLFTKNNFTLLISFDVIQKISVNVISISLRRKLNILLFFFFLRAWMSPNNGLSNLVCRTFNFQHRSWGIQNKDYSINYDRRALWTLYMRNASYIEAVIC